MKIVIDTNVLISGIFFGGYPKKILLSLINNKFTACATVEIINEYYEIIQEMINRKQGNLNKSILDPLVCNLDLIETKSNVKLSRDPDDDKFLACAKDAGALYIVSGDKDLLVLNKFENIEIITAKDFCDKYL
ncbi:MAG: putative toxin-antitoxin system toxin component, PIN family [Alphaproteobacteria bacterium]|nr:putative toxin-antitoxin system toxin component, PIN family [Alphaproteobacteria bacterium]